MMRTEYHFVSWLDDSAALIDRVRYCKRFIVFGPVVTIVDRYAGSMYEWYRLGRKKAELDPGIICMLYECYRNKCRSFVVLVSGPADGMEYQVDRDVPALNVPCVSGRACVYHRRGKTNFMDFAGYR
jgi:hypothetical protein